MTDLLLLSVRIPRDQEITPEQAVTLVASLAKATQHPNIFFKLIGRKPLYITLEVTCLNQEIRFVVIGPKELETFLSSQILAAYPLATIEPLKDYLSLSNWSTEHFHFKYLSLTAPSYYPLKTFRDFKDIDPLSALLGVMSKASPDDGLCFQITLSPPGSAYSKAAVKALAPDAPTEGPRPQADPAKKIIEQKIGSAGSGVAIRVIATNPRFLSELAQSLYIFNRPDGNSLKLKKPFPWQTTRMISAIRNRTFTGTINHVLNVEELASLWHLPGETVKIANIAWSEKAFSEAPENLPIFTRNVDPDSPDNPNREINFLAKTVFKNAETNFGIKREDRMRHMYIIGKSGSGKSTLLENMAVDDFKKDVGMAFIDPHGDGVENLLNYIPAHRINQTVYFNPADREFPVALNMLEVKDPSQAELVASGIVAIFHKLYGNSWGPRLEYILRNTILTLAYVPGTTLVDVPTLLTNPYFRNTILEKIHDEVLLRFWNDEFNRMNDKLLAESISPILNKVGQFVTSPLIRSVIGHQKSTIDLEKIMDEGHILLCNLSQGKLGEDNAALLGAMIITKIELAAMNRVHTTRQERKDFYLFVDEFQNFATTSFIKILAEARKYRLGLVMANQYIAQIPEEIQKAIFGNAGSTISFVIGAEDALIMEREFGEIFTQADLVALKKYQIATRLTIDGEISRPFQAITLPPFKSTNQNRDKVIRISRERFATKVPPVSLSSPTIAPDSPAPRPLPRTAPLNPPPPHPPFSSLRPSLPPHSPSPSATSAPARPLASRNNFRPRTPQSPPPTPNRMHYRPPARNQPRPGR